MQLNGILDNFALPEGAAEALAKANVQKQDIGDGVSRISGSIEGVPYRFFVHTEYNARKSKAAHYEVFDEVEMLQLFSDPFSAPTHRVVHLPPELLAIDPYTQEATGKFAESYRRFKAGKSAPGTALSKWGVMSDGEVATLNANMIFTVEQFAEMPKTKVVGKFPQEFHEYYERAQQFVNGKQNRMEADKQAAEIMALAADKERMAREMAEMKEQMAKLMADSAKKKGGRPKKAAEVPPEEQQA